MISRMVLGQKHRAAQQLECRAKLRDPLRTDLFAPVSFDPVRESTCSPGVRPTTGGEAHTRGPRIVGVGDALDVAGRLELRDQ